MSSVYNSELALSVVIVSFNTKDLLLKCLSAVCANIQSLPADIIIVDNASADGSAEAAAALKDDRITLIKNAENIGFAAANNQAFNVARGRYLLLLNSDAFLHEGSVKTLMAFMDDHPQAAAVGPKILNADGTLQNKGFCFPTVAGALLVLSGLEKFARPAVLHRMFPRLCWDEDRTLQVDFLHGCCMLIRRDAIEATGGFPEDYFMYFEEQDWCYRARQLGYQIWYHPAARVIHVGSASPMDNRADVFNKSLLIFYRRHIGIARGVVITSLQIFATGISLVRATLAPRDEKDLDAVRTYLAQRVGLLKGLMGFGKST